MIYSDDFVWLHVPKCAGTKIEKMFEKYYTDNKEIHQDPIGGSVVLWHDSVSERETRDPNFYLANRTVVCSIRRLPSWLISRYNYEVQRSPALAHRPERLLIGRFLEQRGSENHADAVIKKYLPESILSSSKVRFIRTEFFEIDFKSVFGDYVDISLIPDSEFGVKENSSRNFVSPKTRKALYDNLSSLYQACPYWKIVEDIAYR